MAFRSFTICLLFLGFSALGETPASESGYYNSEGQNAVLNNGMHDAPSDNGHVGRYMGQHIDNYQNNPNLSKAQNTINRFSPPRGLANTLPTRNTDVLGRDEKYGEAAYLARTGQTAMGVAGNTLVIQGVTMLVGSTTVFTGFGTAGVEAAANIAAATEIMAAGQELVANSQTMREAAVANDEGRRFTLQADDPDSQDNGDSFGRQVFGSTKGNNGTLVGGGGSSSGATLNQEARDAVRDAGISDVADFERQLFAGELNDPNALADLIGFKGTISSSAISRGSAIAKDVIADVTGSRHKEGPKAGKGYDGKKLEVVEGTGGVKGPNGGWIPGTRAGLKKKKKLSRAQLQLMLAKLKKKRKRLNNLSAEATNSLRDKGILTNGLNIFQVARQTYRNFDKWRRWGKGPMKKIQPKPPGRKIATSDIFPELARP